VSSFDNWADVVTGDTTCSERMEQGLAFPLWDPSLGTLCGPQLRRTRAATVDDLSRTHHTLTPNTLILIAHAAATHERHCLFFPRAQPTSALGAWARRRDGVQEGVDVRRLEHQQRRYDGRVGHVQ